MLEERELSEAVRGLGSLDASEREAWVSVLGGSGGGVAGWDAGTSAMLETVETTEWSLLHSDRLRCESAARVLASAEWSAMPETAAAACRLLFSLADEDDEQTRSFAVAGLVAAAMPQTCGFGVMREKIVGLLRAGDASALRNVSPVVEAVSGDPSVEEEVTRLVREVCARDEDGGGADVLEAALSRAPPPAAAEVLVRAARSGPPAARRAAIRGMSRVGGGLWAWHNDAALAALVEAASEEEEGVAAAGRRGAGWRVDVRASAMVGLRRVVGASLQRGDGRAGRAPRDGGDVLEIARGELGERRALAVCLGSLPRQGGGCLFALLHADVVRMVVALASA